MVQRILISTGGSGGHVVPATILYEHLKDQFHISMTTDDRGMKFLDKKKYNIETLRIRTAIYSIIFKKSEKYLKNVFKFLVIFSTFI